MTKVDQIMDYLKVAHHQTKREDKELFSKTSKPSASVMDKETFASKIRKTKLCNQRKFMEDEMRDLFGDQYVNQNPNLLSANVPKKP